MSKEQVSCVSYYGDVAESQWTRCAICETIRVAIINVGSSTHPVRRQLKRTCGTCCSLQGFTSETVSMYSVEVSPQTSVKEDAKCLMFECC